MTLLPPSEPILLLEEAWGTKKDKRQLMSVCELLWLSVWAYISRVSKQPSDHILPLQVCNFLKSSRTFCCFMRVLMGWRPSVDFPCGGQLAKGADKGREVESWVWPEIPLLILPECVCDQEGEGWYSAISAAASALRHICALLHLRETEKLSLKLFYNLYVCFFKWSLLLVKLVRPGLTDQCFQKVTTVWSIILESSIVPSANDNSLSNFSSSLTFPKGAAVLPVVPCAREAVADVILLSLLTALQRVFCPGLLK